MRFFIVVVLVIAVSSSKFSLQSFSKEALLRPISPKICHFHGHDVILDKDDNFDYLLLVDMNVRTLKDIDDSVPIPFWPHFKKKLLSSKQDVSTDKFLYSHDVGVEKVCKISIARLPNTKYQKLDLSRRIMESLPNPNIAVCMTSVLGELLLDMDMCECLQAAYQINKFTMPSMKKATQEQQSSSPPTLSANRSGHKNEVDSSLQPMFPADGLHFILPGTPLSTAEEPTAVSLDEGKESLSTSSFYQVSSTPEIQERVSALAAMMEATSLQRSFTSASIAQSLSADTSADRDANVGVDELSAHLQAKAQFNHGTNIARSLSSLPPNVLNARTYTNYLRTTADEMQWQYSEWNPEQMRDLGCGAFFAVTEGNGPLSERTDRLVRLKYSPPAQPAESQKDEVIFPQSTLNLGEMFRREMAAAEIKPSDADVKGPKGFWRGLAVSGGGRSNFGAQRPVVLVGKGVCYDTGGLNIKSANSMKTMKHDMAGSAVALGLLTALTRTEFPLPVECWLAVVENNGDNKAYRPDDVVTAVTGDTIEVVHTDAEGRMLLADVLALASRKVTKSSMHTLGESSLSPRLLLDFATLTGTCISSLSNRYIGAFSNRRELSSRLIEAGERSGERLWPFPVDEDFEEDLLSDVADVLQCRQPTEADHIYAAVFLKRFVNPAVPWVHLDLGSSHRPGGLGHVTTDFTGAGVLAAAEIIRDLC